MLSHKLVASIEDHSERLTAAVTERIRRDPELASIGRLGDLELREIGFRTSPQSRWLAGRGKP